MFKDIKASSFTARLTATPQGSSAMFARLFVLAVGILSSLNGVTAARSSGCGKAATVTSGTKTITHNGKQRQYILQLPSNYNQNTAYKLIMAPHWLNGNMNAVANDRFYGLQPLSNNTAIFVAPNGINAGWGNSGGEDITFLDTIISTVQTGACVDTSLIFSAGWSYGGSMSYALACARGNIYRAVAVYSGAQLSGCSGGTTPVAYLGVHGIHDSVLNISNGRSIRDTFVRANGCQSQNPQEPPLNSLRHIKTQYSGCRADKPVTWIAFDGDHTWTPLDGGNGNASNTYVSPETWSFFSQFSGDGGNTTSTVTTTASTSTPTSSTGGCTVAKWGQCGGSGYTGCKTCEAGSTCTFSNEWYSQCL